MTEEKFRLLLIQRDTVEGARAVSLMQKSGLPFSVCQISEGEARERASYDRDQITKLLASEGIFDIEGIEWYVRGYGKDSKSYQPDRSDI